MAAQPPPSPADSLATSSTAAASSIGAAVPIDSVYQLAEKIGSGAFSDVYRATRISDKLVVAVKQIKKYKVKNKADIETEVAILKKLNHPNIMQLYEVFDCDEYTYLALENLGGGELFDRIVERGSYTEQDAAQLIKQVLSAVSYMHEQRIVHRDLKPENLLCASADEHTRIVISDFGLACELPEGKTLTHPCGTPGYAAPEVLLKKPYAFKVDCFSVGVIAYILLCGYPPFFSENEDNNELYDLTVNGRWEFDSPDWDDISSAAKTFISNMMAMDSAKRLSSAEALKDSWVTGETASSRDMHRRISQNFERYFAKRRWRLAFNAQRTLNRLRVFSSGKKGQASPQRSDGAATPPPQADSKPGLTQMLPSMNITEE